jgi:hypothetical protein
VGSAGRPQRGRDQLCVAVLGQLAQLSLTETPDVAISVVVRHPGFGGDLSAALDDDVIALGDKAIRGVVYRSANCEKRGSIVWFSCVSSL